MDQAVQTTGRSALPQGTRRALLLRDGTTFLILLLLSGGLFSVTLFLFHSFEVHRQDLAMRWEQRGRQSLAQKRPQEAIAALRAAISYAPDDVDDQLLLAQALADAGDTDQATAYFLNLHAAKPGDGFINLQLARLARSRSDNPQAVEFYRASIFGDWPGDGAIRRREVRFELIDYLIQQHNGDAARAEILTAAGNAPDTLDLDLSFGDKARAAHDLADAGMFYARAVAASPRNPQALRSAGETALAQGEYDRARMMLNRAVDEVRPGSSDSALAQLAQTADRFVALSLSRELPAQQRARHILDAAGIAEARLGSCMVQANVVVAASSGQASDDQAAMLALQARWKGLGSLSRRAAALQNADGQDALTDLIFATEQGTASLCGAPTGDDAVLLRQAIRQQESNP